jgi:hypothetical protein
VRQRDLYSHSVFINCPFSPEYQPIFRAILFSVYACGYRPRCALEISDSTQNRLSKIEGIIEQSKFGIHDISFVNLDLKTKLPRFNMPFELGMFFAAKRFGSHRQKQKIALILDSRAYRYRALLSDISGQDIEIHKGVPKTAIRLVRDWLSTCHRKSDSLPGGDFISKQYQKFSRQLPAASKELKLSADTLTYADICRAIESWLKDNA